MLINKLSITKIILELNLMSNSCICFIKSCIHLFIFLLFIYFAGLCLYISKHDLLNPSSNSSPKNECAEHRQDILKNFVSQTVLTITDFHLWTKKTLRYFSKYFVVCFTEERKSHRFVNSSFHFRSMHYTLKL